MSKQEGRHYFQVGGDTCSEKKSDVFVDFQFINIPGKLLTV